MPSLAVDVMSGDRGATECVPGALAALETAPGLRLQLVGQADVIDAELRRAAAGGLGIERLRARFEIVDAPDVVAMTDHPREAIRRKKRSSMRVAIDLVGEGRATGAVSSGNTGALTAMAHFVLKCLPQVERAPIMSAVPAAHGFTHMLDLGANTKATPEQLLQFCVMGSIVARDVHGVPEPRIGLLNIGSEEIKGHELVQEAHRLVRAYAASPLNYVGFVEGNDIFAGTVDVVVTDGFTGNVALKSMEGLAALIVARLREEFTAGPYSRLAALFARPVLRRVATALDPGRYNGAIMVGLNAIVVKSHGAADRCAFAQAIDVARTGVERGLIGHVASALHGAASQGAIVAASQGGLL